MKYQVFHNYDIGDTIRIKGSNDSLHVISKDSAYFTGTFSSFWHKRPLDKMNRFIVQKLTYDGSFAYKLGSGVWIHLEDTQLSIARILLVEKNYRSFETKSLL